MTNLPAHIEAYLLEAGFTTTEILVLKRLMEGKHTTLRELAARTGKSTGVLDQATKKLLRKKILTKEMVNGSPKYTLHSVDAIANWMKEDMKRKREVLKRKQENFESFIATLKNDVTRPEMEYFEGEEGLKRAYVKLLDCKQNLLSYKPVTRKEEDEPLRAFLVEYFRERRRRGAFLRVISHNTPLGRRFRSRDAFEYRETLLVPEDAYPFNFEKIICGDTVACFNDAEQKACFIRFPELAESERGMFEMIWAQEKNRIAEGGNAPPRSETHASNTIPISTRTLSGLREFLVSRKSLATFAVLGVLSAGITYGLYRHNIYLNTQRVRENALAIVATGALQFDSRDLEELRVREDAKKPAYAKVISQLNEIRNQNHNVVYAYIMRPTSMDGIFEFVADADSLDLDAKIDLNNDGIIDEADHLSPPGEPYEAAPMFYEALRGSPAADRTYYTDQWGTFLSAYAPIFNDNGDSVAILGVDRDAQDIYMLSRETFTPVYWFVALFFLFSFIRLAAFNKSLFRELLKVLTSKKALTRIILALIIAIIGTHAAYKYALNLTKDEIGQRLMAMAATAAPEIDPADVEQITIASDMEMDPYQRIFERLNRIRDFNENVKYVYVLRPTNDPAMWEFVADADSSIDLPYWVDENNDGIMQPEEVAAFPGKAYYSLFPKTLNAALRTPAYEKNFVHDQWGTFLSAYAPVTHDEKSVAILGIDMEISDVLQLVQQKYYFFLWIFFILLSAVILYTVIIFHRP